MEVEEKYTHMQRTPDEEGALFGRDLKLSEVRMLARELREVHLVADQPIDEGLRKTVSLIESFLEYLELWEETHLWRLRVLVSGIR